MQVQTAHVLLLMFCAAEESFKQWMETPFTDEGATYATDGAAMIRLPFEMEKYKEIKAEVKIGNVVHSTRNVDVYPPVERFLAALKKCDLYDEYEPKRCPECEEGADFCKYCDNGWIDIPTGRKYYNLDKQVIKIGEGIFSPVMINKLLLAAFEQGVEHITQVYAPAATASHIFQIGEAEVYLMPVMAGEHLEEPIVL